MVSEPLTREGVEAIIRDWPPTPREAATTVIGKYGPPQEATPSLLLWSGTGPWKWTMLWRDEAPHRFPQPHVDVLEQAIDYRVPPEKASELAAFDGSVIVERTKGELSARCEGEEANFLALNLAHQIVTGQMGVEQARRRYTEAMQAFSQGRRDPDMAGLRFEPPTGARQTPTRSPSPRRCCTSWEKNSASRRRQAGDADPVEHAIRTAIGRSAHLPGRSSDGTLRPRRLTMPQAIDRDGVRRLADQGAQLVEVLPANEYAEDHLPGAINLPLRRLEQQATKVLDRQRAVVVYCWDSA